MRIRNCILALFVVLSQSICAQSDTLILELDTLEITGMPGFHSGALISYNGRWIAIGGRTNGLHGFQSAFSFPFNGKNMNAYLINPITGEVNSASMLDLPETLYEPLTSSNIPFCVHQGYLYMIGGYGWKESVNDYVTFPTMHRIDLACLETSILAGQLQENCIEQITDDRLAITGGHLKVLDGKFHLVFGHRFDGIYAVNNGNNAFYHQEYSNEIRRFNIVETGNGMEMINFEAQQDTVNFHRRDYNLVHQIFPDGSDGFTAFSGVFQKNAVLPYLNTVDISSTTATVVPNFDQHLSQYHNAVMPIFDSTANKMDTYFFGGMSRFRIDTQTQEMIDDTLVPFVKTISRVSRDANGILEEEQLPIEMPAFLGSNMEFILADGIATNEYGIILSNKLPNQRTLVGYLIGGILSPEENISETDPTISEANTQVFGVYINKTSNDSGVVTSIKTNNALAFGGLSLHPNPASDFTLVDIHLNKSASTSVALYDQRGKLVKNLLAKNLPIGDHQLKLQTSELSSGVYFLKARADGITKTISLIIQHN
jgi:hypothetical protein